MERLRVCILFGGVSPEHEVSLRSAESVLEHIDREKYDVFPVGITKDGNWLLYGSSDFSAIPAGAWEKCPGNCRVLLSPVGGQGLLCFREESVCPQQIDVVFPLLHGLNGEDGAIQGLTQLAGIPCVGPQMCASAAAMNKTFAKRLAAYAGIRQAAWRQISRREVREHLKDAVDMLEEAFPYPVVVKPAKGGSSVGVRIAQNQRELEAGLRAAAALDDTVLVEEYVRGREIEVAVLGNNTPAASVCGEIDPGAQFYDYDAKYLSATAAAYIPARLPAETAEEVRDTAVRVYTALGCRGMARVDFFVTYDENRVVFNEINTLPGFTSISMFPKLMEASGIPYRELIDELLRLAMEALI